MSNGIVNGELNHPCTGSPKSSPPSAVPIGSQREDAGRRRLPMTTTPRPATTATTFVLFRIIVLVVFGIILEYVIGFECEILNSNENENVKLECKLEIKFGYLLNGAQCPTPPSSQSIFDFMDSRTRFYDFFGVIVNENTHNEIWIENENVEYECNYDQLQDHVQQH